MSDLFIFAFFILVFFVFPAVFGKKKTPVPKSKILSLDAQRRMQKTHVLDEDDGRKKPVWKVRDPAVKNLDELKARLETMAVSQGAKRAARDVKSKTSKRIQKGLDHYAPDRPEGDSKDADDQNPHRRSDWGTRAGPGVLSPRNLFILILVGLVVTILANMPVSLFK